MTKNKVFWILQITGWSVPALNSWAKFFSNTPLSSAYIASEGMSVLFAGIFSSYYLRKYLSNSIGFDDFSRSILIKTSVAYVLATVLYFSLTLLLVVPLYAFFQQQALKLSKIMMLSNVLNSFIFMLIWLVLYIIFKTIVRLQAVKFERLQLQTELKEAQLNTLKGQLNPHFMFNSLNNIRGLILEDTNKARDMLTRLSEMLRYALGKNTQDKISLQEELEMVMNYIALAKIQFENRLHYHCQIDENLLSFEIPPMIVQMLIENSVKHGISMQKNGGDIQLTIKNDKQSILIEVENTGNLQQQSHSTQLGINNIKKRLQLLYKNKASFTLVAKKNKVRARIRIKQA